MTPDDDDPIERLYYSVIGAFFEVYNTLGGGLFERLYMAALEIALVARGHRVRREVPASVLYKGHNLGTQRLDMLVDDVLVVEGKASEHLPRSASHRVHNYLGAPRLDHGLLLHFGAEARFFRCRRR